MKMILVNFIFLIGLVHCRSPLTSLRSNSRVRPLTSTQLLTTSSTTDDEFQLRNSSLSATAVNSTTYFAESDQSITLPETIKVVSAIVAPSKSSSSMESDQSNNSTVQVITANVLVESMPAVVSLNETSTTTVVNTTTVKPVVLSFRERFLLHNWDATRSNRPTNSPQLLPKRPLLSVSMSRYLAKARDITKTTSPTITSTEETHNVKRRSLISWMSPLDDFVLDVEDK